MNTLAQIDRMCQLHELIKNENTGSSSELARRLHVSQRTISYYIEELRELGALINYDGRRCTYYYKNNFAMIFNLEIRVSSIEEESINIPE